MLKSFRVLHAAQMRVPAVGIARQMREEQKVAELNGVPWCSRLFVPYQSGVNEICVESEITASDKWAFKRNFFQWLSGASKDFDVIVLRHSLYSPEEVRFIRNSSKPIYLVHHTLEVPELLSSRGLIGKFLALGERYFGARAISAAAGVVAVTGEIGRYELRRATKDLPIHLYPNGLILDKATAVRDERHGDVPELVFVASHFAPWHGLDLLVKAAKGSSANFCINLVGCLTDEQRNSIKEDPRFVEHGLMNSEQIADIVAKSWVGIGSLALDRLNMAEACPLKVREYLAGGLPVYAGYSDVFPQNFPFFKKGPVDINAILAFARAVKRISRNEVVETSAPYIEKGALINSLYRDICDGLNQGR